ncbi:acyl-CoA dehydrogenase family protein [Allokutzneria sp. NRRL B-24872]|uniref:acyl-CoA dehydrogenase family protein n=1 Tax=Allokutzneria sp. NRRL B-24872 TaxID=1137961 RepID=UPI000A390762|nr:acyl-CoA dehydrogenase family protein [Allokutzneria sp. NRRL B-24872]
MTGLLHDSSPAPSPKERSAESVAAAVRELLRCGELALPLPGGGQTAHRWAALAAWGRRDLTLARLGEGHVDAVAILAEAGRAPVPDALYGVWAAKSEGTGATLTDKGLGGTVRFCSGLTVLDRALVAAGDVLLEVDLRQTAVRRRPLVWQAIGMDASDSGDAVFDGAGVDEGSIVGEPGWYVSRPGFAHGGAGVAAVWLGGCAGILDSVLAHLRARDNVDEHQLAHLGAVQTSIRASEALLLRCASVIDEAPRADVAVLVDTCRAAVERTACEVLERAPKITGPSLMCRDRDFARRLADLQVYIRQHHAERALAALGTRVLAGEGIR